MFSLKELQKLKLELFNSLVKEAKDSLSNIPKSERKKAEAILKKYIDTKSIAGLELWINGASEFVYFLEAKNDLEEIKNDSTLLKEFQEAFTESLKTDFGVEDFRFIDWERANPKYPTLKKLLEDFSKEALKACNALEENVFLGTKSDFSIYKKADGDPSTKGLKVKTTTKKTPLEKLEQIKKAREYLEIFWEEGFELYSLLTDKVHIVESNGLVSYSHFNEQGISYINFIDRELLDSIDDLIHENAHHHLNLIIKKHKVFKKDFKDDIFYSPWRRSLRSMYGIIHASFTFSYAALLFYNILLSQDFDKTPLTHADLDRARMRFLEETLMVNYSLDDLKWGTEKGLFTKKGIEIIKALDLFNAECMKYVNTIYSTIESKGHRKEIETLLNTLNEAKNSYPLP